MTPVYNLYAEKLVKEGVVDNDHVKNLEKHHFDILDESFNKCKDHKFD
jgi:2-oxoglutarate dehydrogenase complex dehydrogenase (E1) component-like enzyme